MQNSNLKILGVVATSLAIVAFAPVSAWADDSERVQSLEKQLAALKQENESLRQTRKLREENAALAKDAPVAFAPSLKRNDPRAAYAADMPVKALPPAPPPVATWTGFYLGATAGNEWGATRTVHGSNDPLFNTPAVIGDVTNKYDINGPLIGATAGYNWQVERWVVGVEADYSAVFAKGSAPGLLPTFNPAFIYGADQHDLATFRGRFGILAKPDLLIYGTGGAALSRITATNTNGQPPSRLGPSFIVDSQYVWGWTAGAGLEWKLAPRLSVKAEYLHVAFDDKSYFNPASAFTGALFLSDQHVKLREDLVRVGFNYQLTQ